ncbi:unnamed protein product [Mytilus edulis]|uniref:Uncharacterized protein n=1 Tax=Mytilus edulis TaxID=6550 RepID=A0A8S3QRB8_MYTED|nr:unnamed protein product [Mytilus edulis]
MTKTQNTESSSAQANEKTCYCLNSDNLPQSHDDTSSKKCLDSTETDYVFIYKQNAGPDINRDWTDTYNCITVDCRNLGRDRIFTAENCDSMYPVICEKTKEKTKKNTDYKSLRLSNKELHHNKDKHRPSSTEKNTKKRSARNFYNATTFCENEDSFVRWDPSLLCTNTKERFDSKHWTSIKRSKQMLLLAPYDENITLKPSQCKGIDTSIDQNKFVKPSFVSCNELRNYYCRYGSRPLINDSSNESLGKNVTMELPENGHITRYITPGTILE